MLDYAIFAATFVIFLILSVIYLYPGSKKTTTIPGPEPVDPLEGNIPDITACESLHEFLVKIHEDYGTIVSFWYGPKMCVSVAAPNLFEEQSAVFDRPYELYKGLVLLFGEETVILASGADGRRRHALYSKCFAKPLVSKKVPIFKKFAKQTLKRWLACPKDEYIPVMTHMYDYSIRTFLESEFGMEDVPDSLIKSIRASFDVCWSDTEKFLIGDGLESGSPREKRFEQHKANLEKVVKDAVSRRKNLATVAEGQKLLIDVIWDLDLPEATKLSDLLTYLVLGFHKTALVLTWAIYFLASNKDIQERVRAEVSQLFGEGDEVTPDTSSFKFLQLVLQETLRLAVIVPYTARVQDFDTMLGGHKIPSGTPVVEALGVVMSDETVFPNPESFDPERFEEENKKNLPALSFEPFGFAGKRVCPGSQLAFAESSMLLAYLLGTFTIDLAPDQVAVQEYGFMTKPKDEVWVTASLFKKEK